MKRRLSIIIMGFSVLATRFAWWWVRSPFGMFPCRKPTAEGIARAEALVDKIEAEAYTDDLGNDPKVDYIAWMNDKAHLRWIRERLRDIEWVHDYEYGHDECLACDGNKPTHKDHCWLKAELDKLDKE